VLFTAAPQILASLSTPLGTDYKQSLLMLESKANLCLALELKNSLSPYYWITVAQKGIPFVLVIEHTRFSLGSCLEAIVCSYRLSFTLYRTLSICYITQSRLRMFTDIFLEA
jgi:hypothetical protein